MITTMESEVLLQRIKELVCAIEPTAQIFLYGSRARNDARPDSDWDILILVDVSSIHPDAIGFAIKSMK